MCLTKSATELQFTSSCPQSDKFLKKIYLLALCVIRKISNYIVYCISSGGKRYNGTSERGVCGDKKCPFHTIYINVATMLWKKLYAKSDTHSNFRVVWKWQSRTKCTSQWQVIASIFFSRGRCTTGTGFLFDCRLWRAHFVNESQQVCNKRILQQTAKYIPISEQII